MSTASAALLPLANFIIGSSTLNVAVLTVTVSPDTIKSPVTVKSLPIVTTSSLSPIVTALPANPPANFVFKFAIDTSSLVSVFVVNVKPDCKYDCKTLTSIFLTVPASLIMNSSVLANPDVNAACPDIISSANIPWCTAPAAIVVALLEDVTSPVRLPILVTVPDEPDTVVWSPVLLPDILALERAALN